MKKIEYIAPSTMVTKINPFNIIAASPLQSSGYNRFGTAEDGEANEYAEVKGDNWYD